MRKGTLIAGLALGLLLLSGWMASPALTVDSSGQIVNWGFTPFQNGPYGNWLNGPPPSSVSGLPGNESGQTPSIAWSEGNNVSPINYNLGGQYMPAPGGAEGERFDTEFLAWRVVGGNKVQVLGISSIDPNSGSVFDGRAYHIGDVFIDVDNNLATGYKGFDVALTSGDWTTSMIDPLHPSDPLPYNHQFGSKMFKIDDVADIHGITSDNAFGDDPPIPDLVNPFAVREGATVISDVTMAAQSYNYGWVHGRNENNTWITEWTLDLSALPIDPANIGNLRFQWTTECGNDVIRRGPREDEPVPEPATLTLLGLGLVSLGLARRRARR